MDETIDPGLDAGESLDVFQPIDPFRELMGFDEFLHTHNVAHGLLLEGVKNGSSVMIGTTQATPEAAEVGTQACTDLPVPRAQGLLAGDCENGFTKYSI